MINISRQRILSGLVGCTLLAGLAAVSPVGIGSTIAPAESTAVLAASAELVTAPPVVTTTITSALPTTSAPASRTPHPPEPDVATQVIELTNAERTRAGCRPLVRDDRLTAAAQRHAEDMATHGYFSHTGRDGRRSAERIRDAGYPRPGGENIARGQETPERVVAAWMASKPHRANILNCELRAIGVGYDTRGPHWVQNFGR